MLVYVPLMLIQTIKITCDENIVNNIDDPDVQMDMGDLFPGCVGVLPVFDNYSDATVAFPHTDIEEIEIYKVEKYEP